LYAPPTARFTELGMSVSLPIFIQLRKDNGRRRISHSCRTHPCTTVSYMTNCRSHERKLHGRSASMADLPFSSLI
jgi:hypothetical protein